ncbi:zinc finger protein 37-like isoform X2 [Bicyclus anynana]|uniref:Zinc finger protein 37-like isoform X2 n=1 Tax=Bicyclus anynana TaxID=110368 RepID=A0ABM3M4D9_BICAN|nr:zinc finger protein 37-like isoform X2 [Bicyclus anynana]
MTKNYTPMVRCCAPFCENTLDNVSTSERTGITFHAVPSEGNLHTAWLRALGTQDHHLPDPAVVCSQHFLDDDFCTTESCVRQIHSHAIPSIVQMCMICLDTGSKLSLMSKHKLEEAYEQLTGLSLCRRGNLKQTLCVLCAQRLINFSRFRDLSLRAHSLMTDLVEQHELNTIQHKELMNCTTAHLKCNLTQTTLGANHCDLYIDHTDEEEQTAAEESVVGDVATVVVKKERSSDSMSSADNLAQDNHCVSKEEYDISIKLEEDPLAEAVSEAHHRRAATSCTAVAKHEIEIKSYIKSESITFGCTICLQEFVEENAYYEHMIMHLQDAGGDAACDASQVCEPRAAVSRSGDSLVLQNKSVYNDAACDASQVCEPRAAVSRSGDSLVLQNKSVYNDAACDASQVCEPRAAVSRSGDSLVLQNKSVYNDAACDASQVSEPRAAVSRSGDSLVLQNKSVYKDAACDASQVCEPRAAVSRSGDSLVLQNKTGSQRLSDEPPPAAGCAPAVVAPLSARLAANDESKVQATEGAGAILTSQQILETDIDELDNRSSHSSTKPCTDIYRLTNCVVQLYDIFKKPKKAVLDENPHVRAHTATKPYSCDLCNYKTVHKGSLLRHTITHTGEKPFSCEICSYKCARKSSLLEHIKTHTGEKPFSCEICSYKCALKSHLLQHIKTHTGEKPFSCEICSYKCARKSNLLQHIKTHTGEKPFSCEICSYKCALKNSLLRHIKTHTGDKPFSCEICSYKCALKSSLLHHIKTHTGEKPFSCEICSYKCALKSNLLQHIKTHTGEKPFSCEICCYKCTRKSLLLQHNKTHTGEKPFSCEICNYKCALKSNLLQHIKTHTGEKPFSCEICCYKCTRKSLLLQHIKTHTGEKLSSFQRV